MNRHLAIKWLIYCLCIHGIAPTYSQIITIGPSGDFATLAAAGLTLSAGDTAYILDGVYSDGTQFLEDVHGSSASPIVIMSSSEYGAIFQGGTEAIHLTNCSHLEIHDLVIEQQTGNGINIDDGGDYTSPTHHITIQNCIFRNMAGTGNNDLLKLSGLDSFKVSLCSFINGSPGGSGIDMVGCHYGVIEDNYFDQAGTSGIQAKGGSQHILIQRNVLKNMGQRALNLGGSTGLQFFRPPLSDPIDSAFEAADLLVYTNIFIGSWAPIAYVGCVRVKVVNNTIYEPENWVIRILQETTEPGFLSCSDNEFRNNIIYLSQDLTEVNIGPNTQPATFIFTNNLWYNASSNSWSPALPVTDSNQVLGDPLLNNPTQEDFSIPPSSPAVGAGINLPEPLSDFVMNSYYAPPSIGAFEGHESTTTAPYLIDENSIKMGPNPFSEAVTIDGDFSNASILILDSNGQILQDLSNSSAPLTIELNTLPDGLYFIQISSVNKPSMSIRRILKMTK